MVFTKNYMIEMFGTVLVLSALLSTASAVDCHGKSFHCVNSTHFMICVDLGGGVSQAIENFFIACPPPTICQGNNHFECEFPAPTTPSTTLSRVITETTLPWEEVVTTSSGNATKALAENYMNTERITTTPDFIVNTDATRDSTATTVLSLSTNNDLNTTEIVPTSTTETVTSATETLTSVTETTTEITNENINITDFIPDAVNAFTTTTVEIPIKTTSERRILPDTRTGAAEEGITPNIPAEVTATNIDISAQSTTENTVTINTLAEITTPNIEISAQTTTENTVTTGTPADITTTNIDITAQTTTENTVITNTPAEITTTNIDISAKTTTENTVTTNTPAEIITTNSDISAQTTTENTVTTNTPTEITTTNIEISAQLTTENTVTTNTPAEITTTNIDISAQTTTDNTVITNTPAEITTTNIDISAQTTTDNTVTTNSPAEITTTNIDIFAQTTTENKVTTNTLATDSGYIVLTTTKYLTDIVTDNLPELKTVQLHTELPQVIILSQNNSIMNNVSQKEPFLENVYGAIEKPVTNIPHNTTDAKPTNEISQGVLSTESTSTIKRFVNSTAGSIEHSTIDVYNKTGSMNVSESPKSIKVVENGITKDQTITNAVDGSEEFVKKQATNEEEYKAPLPTIENVNQLSTDPTDNRIMEVSTTVDELIIEFSKDNSTHYDYLEVPVSTEVPLLYENDVKKYITLDENINMNLNQVKFNETLQNGVNIEQAQITNEERLTTYTTLNLAMENITVPTNQVRDLDIRNTEATYIPSKISNTQPILPATPDKLIVESPLSAKVNNTTINNEAENGAGTEQPTTTNADNLITEVPLHFSTERNIVPTNLAINLNIISSEAAQTSTINNIAQPIPSTFENYFTTEASIIPTTSNNDQPLASTVEDQTTTEAPLPTAKNIAATIDNHGPFEEEIITEQSVNIEFITTDGTYIATAMDSVQQTPPASPDNAKTEAPLLTTKNIESTVSSETSTNSFMASKPDNFLHSDAGIKTVVQFMTSTSDLPSRNVIELHEKQLMETAYEDTITTESTISVSGFPIAKAEPITVLPSTLTDVNEKTNVITAKINHKTLSTTISNNDKKNFYVSPTGVENTKNVLLLSTRDNNNNTNVILTTENSILINEKPASESLSENSSFSNSVSLDTKASPMFVNDKELITTTRNYTAPYNEVATIATESNDLKDKINWNPLSNYLINKDPETVTHPSVTNASVTEINRNTSSLDMNFISQLATNQNSIGDPNLNHNLAMNKLLENITQVYRQPETEPSEILVVKDSINMNRDTFAPTVGIDVTSTATTNHNTYKSSDNLFSPPESIVHTTENTLTTFASNQDQSIVSLSKSTSTAKKYADLNFPPVHTNLPSQIVTNNTFEINTRVLPEATGVGTTTIGSNVNKESDISSKPVMLDILPLPVNNIKWSLPVTNPPFLTGLTSSKDDAITIVTTASYRPLTLDPIFTDSRIQASANVGDPTTVPKTGHSAFYVQKRVPTAETSNSNSQTRVFAETNNTVITNVDATLNPKNSFIDIPLQYPQQGKIVFKKIASTLNNKSILSEVKPSVSEINTAAALNSFSLDSLVNTHTRISQEPVLKVNNESRNSENRGPQNVTFSTEHRNNNLTVITGLQIAPQNIATSNTRSAQANKFSANITSPTLTKATQLQGDNRTSSQPVTTKPISGLNNNPSKQVRNEAAQSYKCSNRIRGRYSDKDDCRKFYICLGNSQTIVGNCPENTVFSDLKKLCTKNMSHCIRENEFKCPSVGRFNDLEKMNVYYICVNHKNNLYRFKFQCQKGYHLNKITVHCVKTNEIESNESVSISSADNSGQTGSISFRSDSSKSSISISSSMNVSRSRADGSRSKGENSSKTKQSNEAAERAEQSEGRRNKSENSSKTKKSNEAEERPEQSEGDDDEVFRCKRQGKFPIPNECRRYYLCKKNEKSEYRRKIKKCDSDQVFHKDKKRCVDAESYEC